MASSSYTIQRGDNLTNIAKRYGTTVDALAQANGITNKNYIVTGKTLSIPGSVPPPVAPTTTPPVTTPTPPATTTTPTDTGRYVRTANANDTLIKDLSGKLDATVLEPNLQTITDEKKKNAQASIDAITAEFNRVLASQNEINNGYNARVRASNISSGLGGSDFATTKAVDQEGKNQKALDLINQEKNARIQEILSDVDSRASEEYRSQREAYVKGLGDQLDRVKKAKDDDRNRALENIKGLAVQGITLDKLKTADPGTYDTLLAEYGGSEIELDSAWNASLPDNLKIKYTEKVMKDKDGKTIVYRYGVDPLNPGKIKESSYKIDVPYEQFATGEMDETKDGRIIMKYPDGTIKYLTDVDKLTASTIAKNNADAYKTYADAKNGSTADSFKFTGTQRSKLVSANFNDAKINAIQTDLRKYGVQAVLDGLSTDEEKNAVKESLKGSDLASQLAEFAANNK